MHLTKKQRKLCFRILSAAALLLLLQLCGSSLAPFYLLPYLIAGWDVLDKALRGIKNGQLFDENFLMTLATIGAIGIAVVVYGLLVIALRAISKDDLALMPKGEKIAKILRVR